MKLYESTMPCILASIFIFDIYYIYGLVYNSSLYIEYHFGGMISEKKITENIECQHGKCNKKQYELYETFTFVNSFTKDNGENHIDNCKIFIDIFDDEKVASEYHSKDDMFDIYKLYPNSEVCHLGYDYICDGLDCNIRAKINYEKLFWLSVISIPFIIFIIFPGELWILAQIINFFELIK